MKNKNLVLFVLLFLLGGELTSASAKESPGSINLGAMDD